MHGFQIAGGSVPGWEHTQPGKPAWHNNQDAYHWRSGEDHLVAVVCDGCSSAPQSELGALLVARLITTVLTQHLSGSFKLSKENAGELLSSLKAELLAVLGSLERVAAMAGVDSLLAESFLHTILGVVMTKEVTLIFSLGDGVWAINGEVSVIPRYEANKPPYLAYHLIPSTLDARDLEFVVLHVLPTCDLESLVIGSDGVADLASAAELPLPLLGTPPKSRTTNRTLPSTLGKYNVNSR